VRALISAIEKRPHKLSEATRTEEELKADSRQAADLMRVWEEQLLDHAAPELLTNVRELVAALEDDEISVDAAYSATDAAAVLEILHLWERKLARASELGVRFVYDSFEL